jgi:hypothetical protein
MLLALSAWDAGGQIDPQQRRLVQAGYYQPLEGRSPIAGYLYYYSNHRLIEDTNATLRLVVAPVYLDAELGIAGVLGTNTDMGLGITGGGFAETYSEIRQGQWIESESFLGHNGGFNLSFYHRFNPNQLIPLWGVIRTGYDYVIYDRADTAPDFKLPQDHDALRFRVGLRLGGQEPVMHPPLALEASVWFQNELRDNTGPYGFDGDRELKKQQHLAWGRVLGTYTLPEQKLRLGLGVTMGTSVDADRFGAFRLGGFLPMSSEFPLDIPGYYFQEISAERFVLFNGQFTVPLDAAKRFHLGALGAIGVVDYLPGMEQSGDIHSGIGGGLVYRSKSGVWELCATYGYGFNAVRSHGMGAQAIGILCQIDLEARQQHTSTTPPPRVSPHKSRGLNWLFRH